MTRVTENDRRAGKPYLARDLHICRTMSGYFRTEGSRIADQLLLSIALSQTEAHRSFHHAEIFSLKTNERRERKYPSPVPNANQYMSLRVVVAETSRSHWVAPVWADVARRSLIGQELLRRHAKH